MRPNGSDSTSELRVSRILGSHVAPAPVDEGSGDDVAVAGQGVAPPASHGWVTRRAAGVATLLAVVAVGVAIPRATLGGGVEDLAPVPPHAAAGGRPTGATADPPAWARGPSGAATPPAGVAMPTSGAAPAAVGPSTLGAPIGMPTAAGGEVLVHVVGQVRRPGVVRLPSGSRVADAVRAAGGTTGRADVAAVNLARPVVDGEQLLVPKPGESVPPASVHGPQPGASPGAGAPLDLNSATEADLDTLPGVGPVIAGRIVAWRQEHGRFTTVDELAEVAGIGTSTLERLRPLVRT